MYYFATEHINLPKWCQLNRLKLNISKRKVVIYSKEKRLFEYGYKIDQSVLMSSDTVIGLGALFDSDLSFSTNVHFFWQNFRFDVT